MWSLATMLIEATAINDAPQPTPSTPLIEEI